MEAKKNPKLDIGANSSLYFAIGLNIMLFLTYSALEMKTYEKDQALLDIIEMETELEEDIPITEQIKTPPPPPPQAAPEIITVVEDIEEIEETVIESTEITQEEGIEERVIEVDDVNVEDLDEDISVPFAVVENVPVFPGCKGKNNTELKACFQEKIQKHLQKHFQYPEAALEMGIHGKVFVMFDIDRQGVVSGIRTRGPDKLLEKEASRIVSLLPKMTPGKQRGKPVRVPYALPINFQLID
ncbi:MAG: energy transducer TonB [Bacteroidia bacterium]|nr:energy transducer TonB [Bacteroidia bacterium]MBT8269713.1 energy transducer TonB [Bacteroidia bacterium]NNF81535.1 energy transducer TonB [Flavobacteriaceae bacterium]NNK69228.1 energy transducer TonB [Flavobacteriaceae bacterium]NNL81192.1 energy transducer TonB [Flavobacteriaceae bacterium]